MQPKAGDSKGVVLCIAGERSGDALLAVVIAQLLERGYRCVGIGGTQSVAAGLEVIAQGDILNAGGLVEVLPRIPGFIHLLRKLSKALRSCDGLVVADSPEIGVRLMSEATYLGLKTMYLAPPQAWAWRPWRERKLKVVDWVGCLFRFEHEWYSKRGIKSRWIGHPLGSVSPIPPGNGLGVAVLPGSRSGSVKRLLPVLLDGAKRAIGMGIVDSIHVSIVDSVDKEIYQRAFMHLRQKVFCHSSIESALQDSKYAIVGAGTASLEAVCYSRPVVICAKVHPISAALARRLVSVEHVGLPNLIMGQRRFPELVQDECTGQGIANALKEFNGRGDMITDAIEGVRTELSRTDFTQCVGEGIDEVFNL